MKTSYPSSSTGRDSGFSATSAATLWHRRLDRTALHLSSKVQPRLRAELVLRPVSRVVHASLGADLRKNADAARAA